MPKRVIDGEGLWRSDKLARVEPAWIKAEFANLVPLALANGSFECNPRMIWSRVYAYNRQDITIELVEEILNEFERVKLLFRWKLSDGKVWGYWVGIDKPGRLPGKSRRGKNEAVGPEPPRELLATYLNGRSENPTAGAIGIHKLPNGNEKLLGSGTGSGFCFGSGSDETTASPSATPTRGTRIPEDFQVTDQHRAYAFEQNLPSPDEHIEEFRDYYRAAPGARGVKVDWDATFRNWLRKARQLNGPAKRSEAVVGMDRGGKWTDAYDYTPPNAVQQ